MVALVAGLTGCVAGQPLVTPAESTVSAPGLANPASVYCADNGGTLDIRADAAGNQTGFCVFADGSECDEWAYFRGECAPGGQVVPTSEPEVANPMAAYCVQQGGSSPDSDRRIGQPLSRLRAGRRHGVSGSGLLQRRMRAGWGISGCPCSH